MSRPATGLAAAIRAALAKRTGVHAWQLQSDVRAGYQTYLVRDAVESERRVRGETHTLTVFVKHGDLLGRSTRTLGPADAAQLGARIDEAVYMAGLGGDAPWALPKTAGAADVPLFDPLFGDDHVRDTSRAIADRWRAAVAAQKVARPSSMELFCGAGDTTLVNSAGLEAHTRGSRVSMLTTLLADGGRPSERISYDERRRASDLDVESIVARVAAEAHDLTEASPPPSGTYPVVIDADELVAFLQPIQNNSSAAGLYQKFSRFETGKPLPIPAGDGEPLTIFSNATTPYGLQSYAFDGDGTTGQRVEIVKDGVFERPWATKQFADYLGTPATGGFANWELPAGKTALAELLSDGGRVLQVRAFSWLVPDGNRGDFGSEIRAHPLDDAYHKARSPQWDRITAPLFSAANWGGQGLHPRGNFEGYVRAASKEKWLEAHGIEHWTHFYTDYGRELQRKFFDWFLKGEDTGWGKQPRVLLQVRHPGEKFVERHENEWPIARTQWTKLYLNSADFSLTETSLTGEAKVTFDALGEGVTFMTPPLKAETEITGPVAAKLFVSSSTSDADLFLVLRVFSADLKEIVFQGAIDPHTPIAQGWLRASHRKLDPKLSTPYRPYHTHDEKQPLTPGVPVELDIELWPTSIVVPARYRVALTVRGKDYEYGGGSGGRLSNFKNELKGCGPFLHDDPVDRPRETFGGQTTLHFAGDRQGYLLLPVIPKK